MLSTQLTDFDYEECNTHRAGKLCYVTPLLEQIDVQPEKGFANSFPGGGVEPTGASYDDFYLDNE